MSALEGVQPGFGLGVARNTAEQRLAFIRAQRQVVSAGWAPDAADGDGDLSLRIDIHERVVRRLEDAQLGVKAGVHKEALPERPFTSIFDHHVAFLDAVLLHPRSMTLTTAEELWRS